MLCKKNEKNRKGSEEEMGGGDNQQEAFQALLLGEAALPGPHASSFQSGPL